MGGPPLLVPPTWNKGGYRGVLASVWQQAANELSEAQRIFVVGYSLPETDSFFRYLYALGTLGPKRLRRFWVFDPEPEGQPDGVKERYQDLIGRGVEAHFKYYQKEFVNALPTIRTELLKT